MPKLFVYGFWCPMLQSCIVTPCSWLFLSTAQRSKITEEFPSAHTLQSMPTCGISNTQIFPKYFPNMAGRDLLGNATNKLNWV